MKITVTVPSALDVADASFDEATRVLSMEPLFYGDGREAVLGMINVFTGDETEPIFKGILKVSGKTGHIHVTNRTKQVKPVLERAKRERKKA